VIPTGVDVERFSPGDRALARSRVGLTENGFVLVAVGRLTRVKRYDRAIHAVARLLKEGLRATLLLVGTGPERESLLRLANELGVAEHVRFEGYRDGSELVNRLQAADLQLCTSEFENWSLALLEGLACGLPVLGTPGGGTSHLLAPIDAVLVLPNGEIEALVRRIALLAADPARLKELGRRARGYAEAFAWGPIVVRIERLLQELASAR
jgi:glycosyltransferase involved in cell wall biosynthesis